jgi:starch synthase (maltosyl-transferring)
LKTPGNLSDLIALVNRVRRENPALQSNDRLRFHSVDNDFLMAYTKSNEDLSNVVLVVVNLDPHHTQSGWLELPIGELEVGGHRSYQMHDLLTGARYLWQGARNYVELDPRFSPAHIFRFRQRVRTERDFDYYL